MREITTYSTFTKIPIFDNSVQSINLQCPINNLCSLAIHAFDQLSNQSIRKIFDEYGMFLSKGFILIDEKPVKITMKISVINNLTVLQERSVDITQMVTNSILNSIDLTTYVTSQTFPVNTICKINIEIVTINILKLGAQSFSLYVKLNNLSLQNVDQFYRSSELLGSQSCINGIIDMSNRYEDIILSSTKNLSVGTSIFTIRKEPITLAMIKRGDLYYMLNNVGVITSIIEVGSTPC